LTLVAARGHLDGDLDAYRSHTKVLQTVRKVGVTISDSGTRANFRGLWSIKARKIADSWIPRDVFWPAREFPHGLLDLRIRSSAFDRVQAAILGCDRYPR
jgi:hypothetical protein